MAIMSLSRFRGAEPVRPTQRSVRACGFERTLRGGLFEGGVLSCVDSSCRERDLRVSMSWEVLAELRAELSRQGVAACDDVIVRSVLRCWGVQEFERRLNEGACLPEEGLALETLGGPCSARPRHLLQAAGLLPAGAAQAGGS